MASPGFSTCLSPMAVAALASRYPSVTGPLCRTDGLTPQLGTAPSSGVKAPTPIITAHSEECFGSLLRTDHQEGGPGRAAMAWLDAGSLPASHSRALAPSGEWQFRVRNNVPGAPLRGHSQNRTFSLDISEGQTRKPAFQPGLKPFSAGVSPDASHPEDGLSPLRAPAAPSDIVSQPWGDTGALTLCSCPLSWRMRSLRGSVHG